jgi:hypothetical protein
MQFSFEGIWLDAQIENAPGTGAETPSVKRLR